MIQKICPDCNNVFEYEPVQGYPDKRIYCDKDKARRKAEWDAKQGKPTQAPAIHVTTQAQSAIKPENGEYQSTVYNHTVDANIYKVGVMGKAGMPFWEHRLAYDNVAQLQAKIKKLKDAGLMDEAMTVPMTGNIDVRTDTQT